jgi:antitoxin (DNA-binding transcriptional repressor) of toxin-antitoxin stability system
MKVITLLEFRKNSKKILGWAKRGERMIMTFRGKPVCRIEPIESQLPGADDPFYQLAKIAEGRGGSLDNKQMDKIIYGT